MTFNSQKQKIYFTSDLHFQHNKEFVFAARGYESPEAHTRGVIDEINRVVGEDDVLINLGDFCLNCSEEQFEQILSEINCKNHFYINGNHNSRVKQAYAKAKNAAFGINSDGVDIYPVTYKSLTFWGDYKEIRIGKQNIILFHFPIDIWNNTRKDWWAICGHCHGNFDKITPGANNGKILDVGWDVFGRPVEYHEIKEIMDKKVYIPKDHH